MAVGAPRGRGRGGLQARAGGPAAAPAGRGPAFLPAPGCVPGPRDAGRGRHVSGRAGGRDRGAPPRSGSPALAGTRNAVLNTEARTADADVLSRRCVLMRLLDFSYERYQRALRQSAGAVVVILPRALAAGPQDAVRVSPRPPCGLGRVSSLP